MSTIALDAAALEKLVSAAVAAPSIHNSQPWHFRLRPETSTLEVRAARERAVPAADPQGRAMHVSVGAAVLNLCVAARFLGWAPQVRLLPDPAEPDLFAAVQLDVSAPARAPGTDDLYEAIWHRHTIRTPFTGDPVPPAVLDELVAAARTEEAFLGLPDAEETARLLEITAEAERRNTTDAAAQNESRSWVHSGDDLLPYGIRPARWVRRTAPGTCRCATSPRSVPPSTGPPPPSSASPGSRCSPPRTTDPWTGCVPGSPWSTSCSPPPSTGSGPRCSTRRWSGPTCAGPPVSRTSGRATSRC
ncbi:hypothetical protein ACFQ0M_02625 [Kitasatospora aburaviensis]